jgi:hypothetical protein
MDRRNDIMAAGRLQAGVVTGLWRYYRWNSVDVVVENFMQKRWGVWYLSILFHPITAINYPRPDNLPLRLHPKARPILSPFSLLGHGRGEKRVQGFGRKARRKIQLERPRRRWEDGIKWILRILVGGVWSRFTWLRIGTVGGLLWTRWWTFGFWRHGVS